MQAILRLSITLAAISALAAGALALTYAGTRDKIAAQQLEAEKRALAAVFGKRMARSEARRVEVNGKLIKYYEVFRATADRQPSYFATIGRGTGYNTSSPLQLLVGCTNPAAPGVPEQAGKLGFVVIGWKVVRSEETPGLGERIKDSKPAATWLEGGPFAAPRPDFDARTPFQKQFEGCTMQRLGLKKDGVADGLDAITAATITSRGVVRAVRDALQKIERAVNGKTSAQR